MLSMIFKAVGSASRGKSGIGVLIIETGFRFPHVENGLDPAELRESVLIQPLNIFETLIRCRSAVLLTHF